MTFQRGDILRSLYDQPFIPKGALMIVKEPENRSGHMELFHYSVLETRHTPAPLWSFYGPTESYYKRVGRLKPDKLALVLGKPRA